jgi:hypothetical protein
MLQAARLLPQRPGQARAQRALRARVFLRFLVGQVVPSTWPRNQVARILEGEGTASSRSGSALSFFFFSDFVFQFNLEWSTDDPMVDGCPESAGSVVFFLQFILMRKTSIFSFPF